MRIVSSALSAEAMQFAAESPSAADRSLVERARRGDAKAFRRIFEHHAPGIHRFLFDLLRDEEAAGEATQETFVRAHARLGALREQEKLVPWLFGISRHVFQETLRSRNSRVSLKAGGTPDLPELVDHAPDPEAVLMGREVDDMLRLALAQLSEERRAALLLRIDHGLEYDQIQEVMGWSLQKVKNEIHRARVELRRRLGKYVGGK
jgi:RNA polymerase sigma-70 factor (ECF subfamily)